MAGGKLSTLKKMFLAVTILCCVFSAPLSSLPGAEAARKGTMQLTSTAFAEGSSIPVRFTCDGENVSPPLKWTGTPPGAKSLALIVDDPDAPMGVWVHWVVYDLAPASTELPEAVAKTQYLPGGAKQGWNDFKHLGYGGPCPPPGKPHRYFFKLFALDRVIDLKPGVTKKDFEAAMEGHKLAEGQLMGIYKRK